ncbi:hypothetical protein D3C71_1870010 [compost metagenome]
MVSHLLHLAEVVFERLQFVRLPSAYQTGRPPHIGESALFSWWLKPNHSVVSGVRSMSIVP